MDKKVLVVYGSKYGATKEIAEKIGEGLRKSGLQADVLPANNVSGLDSYKAVVLGSAIYVGNWQKDVVAFLKANEKTLSSLPVWLFSSGPSGKGNPLELVEGQLVPAGLQPIVDRIRPRDNTIFHGNIDLDKINSIEKFAVKNIVKKPFGDFRDWESINAWSLAIAKEVKKI